MKPIDPLARGSALRYNLSMRYYAGQTERLSTFTQTLAASQTCRAFLEFAICRAISPTTVDARQLLRERLGADNHHEKVLTKAIVSPLMAGPETEAFGAYQQEFAKLAVRTTLLGRMDAARRAPMGLPIALASTPPTAEWVAEGLPIPLKVGTLSNTTLPIRKIATMSVFTKTFAKSGGDAAVSWIEKDVTAAIKRGADEKLLDGLPADPSRPASILYGVSPIGGGSPAAIEDDLADLFLSVRAGEATTPTLIASPAGLMYLSKQRTNGVPLFPTIDVVNGGHVNGIPVLVSVAAGSKLVLLDQWSLLVYLGGIDLDASSEADVQMTSTPTDLPVHLVSLWQGSYTAIRAVQDTSWALSASDAVGYLELPV